MNYDRPELLDRLAAEYVLGTLRGPARRRFERLLPSLPGARAAVEAWERRLAPLATPVAPVDPSARVWPGIEGRIGAAPARAASPSWWRALWRPAFGFALGAMLTLGLVRLQPDAFVGLDELAQREQALPQSYVGLLTDAENRPTVLVSSTRYGRIASVKFLRPVTVPPGKVLQIWALPAEGAPLPLGVADTAAPPGSTRFEMPGTSETLLATVPRLAASFEDAPSRAGNTPAPFVLSGFCVKLW